MPSVAISVSDATAIEGSATLKSLDHFISNGSGGLGNGKGITLGPDGNHDGAHDLYVVSDTSNCVLRYDGITGSFIDTFVTSASGGLNHPIDLAFGLDGKLYVSSIGNNQVLQYDGSSGAFVGVAASGLAGPLGLTFGPDGSLYIAKQNANEVLRYNSGGLSTFVTAGSGGLNQPRKAVFGPDGNGDGVQDLYVASQGNGKVLRFNGLTGAFIDMFATTGSTQGPMWLGFGTDGYLYTTARTAVTGFDASIIRFNAATGALVDTVAFGHGGWAFLIGPENLVYTASIDGIAGSFGFVERFGPSSLAAFTVSLDSASVTSINVDYSTADGTALAGTDYVAASSTLTFAPGQTTRTILVPTIYDALSEPTEAFTVNLSNPTGAVIADSQGVATIQDYVATKYYVVNDGSPDQTYRYDAPGNALGNYVLNSGDTAPRGAASTAAGTMVWVVDANKTVYVYNNGGYLLGSWTPGGLNPQTQLEGIATNGTDVWLVDAKQDKVFRYTGAASRLSGSQNAASSFSLNSGNSGAKDLVTDGTSIWVVNDAATDKVFKYTLTGSLLGSWTLTGGGGSPTGITLDPSNGQQHLWVVDSASDVVYQYDNARSRTSGSQAASVTFALAAGNTNPQGIADPPAPDTAVPATPEPSAWWWTGPPKRKSGLFAEWLAGAD